VATPPTAPEFASFHADRPAGTDAAHPNTTLQAQSYMRMLDLLFRSARLFHRGARCTLLTSPTTVVAGLSGRVRRVDVPVDHARLMLSRARAQLAHVEASDFTRPLVLLDSDILLRASMQPLFADDFDVAVTWRPSASMPINGGLLVLNNRRPEAVRAFCRRFVACYAARHSADGNDRWYGDQHALREIVGLTARELHRTEHVMRDGCRIRLLPCDQWNFSPDNRLAAIADGLPDKVVLHFKGQRKRLMEPFWSAFLAPQAAWWPWRQRREQAARARLAAAAAAEAAAPPLPAEAEVDA
jgi:hypothetical protein